MKHHTDSWYAPNAARWFIAVDVSGAPLTVDEAKALLQDLKREIERAERDDREEST